MANPALFKRFSSSSRRRTRDFLLLGVALTGAMVGVWSCGSSGGSTPSPTGGDGGGDSSMQNMLDSGSALDSHVGDAISTAVDGGPDTGTDSGRSDAGGGDSGGDSGGDAGGGDAGGGAGTTCKTILAATPGAASGLYTIDLDGSGTVFPPIKVYCDMAFDGGGWTIIQSFIPNHSPGEFVGATDSGVYLAAPQPGVVGGLADWVVAELALHSSQVHIRDSFASTDGGTWVTSVMPDGGATNVITNLRNLDVLTKGTDGGYGEWTGPSATAATLSWVPLYGGTPSTCEQPVDTATKYPSVYWACGNFTSMDILASQGLQTWNYTGGTSTGSIEVYVR
jgi:hypothetical protein